jgi:hypothetical protein
MPLEAESSRLHASDIASSCDHLVNAFAMSHFNISASSPGAFKRCIICH